MHARTAHARKHRARPHARTCLCLFLSICHARVHTRICLCLCVRLSVCLPACLPLHARTHARTHTGSTDVDSRARKRPVLCRSGSTRRALSLCLCLSLSHSLCLCLSVSLSVSVCLWSPPLSFSLFTRSLSIPLTLFLTTHIRARRYPHARAHTVAHNTTQARTPHTARTRPRLHTQQLVCGRARASHATRRWRRGRRWTGRRRRGCTPGSTTASARARGPGRDGAERPLLWGRRGRTAEVGGRGRLLWTTGEVGRRERMWAAGFEEGQGQKPFRHTVGFGWLRWNAADRSPAPLPQGVHWQSDPGRGM